MFVEGRREGERKVRREEKEGKGRGERDWRREKGKDEGGVVRIEGGRENMSMNLI